MYKVITHAIREEHFDHPMTAEMAMTRGNVMPRGSNVSSIVNYYTTSPALIFRGHVRSQFETYLFYIRNYVLSAFNGAEDLAAIEKSILDHTKKIAKLLDPYYSEEVVAAAAAKLADYSKHVVAVVQAIKTDSGVSDAEQKLKQTITDVATTFHSVNPYWPTIAVADYLTRIAEAVVKQSRARKSKNWAADMEALEQAQIWLLSGNSDTPGYPSFSEVFAKGVISAFPDKFSDFKVIY